MAPDAADLPGLRVAVQTDNGLDTPTPETVAAIEAAAQALAAAGALVEPASPPGGGHELTIDVWRSYGDASDLYDILRRWDGYRSEMLAWFAAHDLILCPVFPDPARRHGDMNRPGERDPTSYTTPYSLTGWPAATVSCGTSPEGLPIGVQLVARPWRDDLALAAAAQGDRARARRLAPAAARLASRGLGRRRARLVSPRRFLLSTRRRCDARVGRVFARGRATFSAPASRRASRSSASSRLRCWERVSCATAVTRPPSREQIRSFWASESAWEAWTSKIASTREAVTLACWPPGPEERETRSSISSSGTSTPSLMGKLGMTG